MHIKFSTVIMAAGKGTRIALEATGADETEAMQAIVTLINEKFGEGE